MVQRYCSIIEAASDGIVAVDENGWITAINSTARKMLDIINDAISRPIEQYVPDASIIEILNSGRPIHDRLKTINGELFGFNHLPVVMGSDVIGGVSTFNHVSQVMKAENEVRRSLSSGLVTRYFIEDLMHTSPSMQDVVELARQFATTDSTVLIMGETGPGKEVLAHSIHNLSHRSKAHLFR
ncbi:MAG: sigma 54-interacting transcriptional regulator [Deltaproteobacteria bacterium]|nr:MAG: sigma 54-interacting transcriptional regulator [Deltaproteobacteria bacterium]